MGTVISSAHVGLKDKASVKRYPSSTTQDRTCCEPKTGPGARDVAEMNPGIPFFLRVKHHLPPQHLEGSRKSSLPHPQGRLSTSNRSGFLSQSIHFYRLLFQ